MIQSIKIMTIGVGVLLAGLTLFSTTAYGDETHRRAQCAQVEMSIELGDDVDPAERAACAGLRPNKPAALVRHQVSADKPSSSDVPALLKDTAPAPNAIAQTKQHSSRPGWVNRIPTGGGMLYGVGIGDNLTTGFQRAVVVIAAQLQVSINAESNIRATSSSEADYQDGAKVGSKGKETQYLSESAQMMVKGALEDIRITDQYTEDNGTIYVLASLDLKALREKEEELYAAVLDILSRASERFVTKMRQNRVIDQESLYELVSVLDEVNTLGKSKVGKKVRKRWRKDYRRFKRLIEKAIQCGDVTAKLHRAKGGAVDAKSSPLVRKGDELRGTFSCRGLPIINARVYLTVEGGISSLPEIVETDDKGRFTIRFDALYGQDNVTLSLRHSLRNIGGAYWLGDTSKTRGGDLRLKAANPPTMSLAVSGLEGENAAKVMASLKAFAVRKWGAIVQDSSDAQLQGTARIELSNTQETNGKYVQSASLLLTVQSKGSTLFEERLRKGALGETPNAATKKSLNNLMQAISRW